MEILDIENSCFILNNYFMSKLFAVVALSLGLVNTVEAKSRKEVSDLTIPFVVDDFRNSLAAACRTVVAESDVSACLEQKLDLGRNETTIPIAPNFADNYRVDLRLAQPAQDLVLRQKNGIAYVMTMLEQKLGSKIEFSTIPVMRFGSYTPLVREEDTDYNGRITGSEVHVPEQLAPYKGMVAYLTLNQPLTSDEVNFLKQFNQCEGSWCIAVSVHNQLWSILKVQGRFLGYTGDISALDKKAPWGIVIRYSKNEGR